MNNKCGLLVIFLMTTVALFACEVSEKSNKLSGFTNIVVQGNKSEEEDAFCKNFSLNEQQAHMFFKKSKIIDAKTMHDNYDYLPCYVYGTLGYNNETCNWEIRAGGTGLIQCPGQDYIIACDSCDELLKD